MPMPMTCVEPRNDSTMSLDQLVLANAKVDMYGVEGQRMLTKTGCFGDLRNFGARRPTLKARPEVNFRS